ncbi:MAG: metallophosphoesterase [Patescibacteria group bacterium]|jgi:Icc-related predicted phosphoesterase
MKKILLISIIALFALTGCTFNFFQNEKGMDSSGVTFAVIGDNEGMNTYYDTFMTQIAKDPDVQFVLHVGDIVENGGQTELNEIIAHQKTLGLDVPMYVVPGNHDIYDDPELTAFNNTFGEIPRSIDIGDVHLVLLNNADRKIGFTDAELDWLNKDLSENAKKNIVLAYHRPFNYPLANTLGDDETAKSEKSNERFQEIIAKYNILAMFNGHIHTYLKFPFIVHDDTNATKSIPVYISGGGGQIPQDIFASLFSSDYHWLKVTIKNGEFTAVKQK